MVYDHLDLTIERGRKVALVGPNGAGKSTLIKLLAGVEPLNGGERIVGHNVTLGYFAQDQTQVLDPGLTVLEEITRAAPMDLVPQVRNILGAFLFSGDAVDKRTSVLSGGERNRLALARLLLHPANCLLLDEPTNHLDIHAKEVLLDALLAYHGTLVLVAHDRYILDRLPDEIIEVGAGTAVRYLGNYEDYLRKKAAGDGQATSAVRRERRRQRRRARGRSAGSRRAPVRAPPASSSGGRHAPRSAAPKRWSRTEAAITAKEAEMSTLAAVINQPDFYLTHDNPQALFSQYARLQKEIEALYAELEKLENAAPSAPRREDCRRLCAPAALESK